MGKEIKIAFFDTKPYDRYYFDQANEKHQYQIQYFSDHLKKDTAHIASGSEAVCAFVNDEVSKEVIETLKSNGTKLIALRSAGYNNVDLKAAFKSIHVVRVPRYSPYAVAEHALALMMSLNRKTHKAYLRTRDTNFSINGLDGFDMHGKVAGVIGTGNIGKCMIPILKGLGMKVLAFDKYQDSDFAKEQGFEYVALDKLYRESDIITLHCPLTKETYHMIGEESIEKTKRGVMIINTSRGKIIKTSALIEGLKQKKIGSAGLDVYEEESQYFFEDFSSEMISDDILARLLTFPNVLVTSHQGFFTREALTNIAETTLDNVDDFFEGKFLKNEICYHCGEDPKKCRKQQGKRCF